jgi:hypothetical protein
MVAPWPSENDRLETQVRGTPEMYHARALSEARK